MVQQGNKDFESRTKSAANKARAAGEEAMESVTSQAQQVGSAARDKTDNAIKAVGEGMASLADTLEEKVSTEGRFGSAASAVAEKLRTSGEYLSDHKLADIAGDVAGLVKRYPMQSLWVGLGIGFFVGTFMNDRRSVKYYH